MRGHTLFGLAVAVLMGVWTAAFEEGKAAQLAYSTYLGGTGEDHAVNIAVDSGGNAYVSGYTGSGNFPTLDPYQGTFVGGTWDVFVSKLTPSGLSLAYSTFLGGSDQDYSRGVAVDSSGIAYVTGHTFSTDFPTKAPYQGAIAGSYDAFVTKLSSSGSSLSYSTYLGGSAGDAGSGIAVDSGGSAYIVGSTSSTNFPILNAYQVAYAGGSRDAFVTRLSPSGSALVLAYSSYLGGSGSDYGIGVAVDGSGAAYVAGVTTSTSFPVKSAYQTTNAGDHDAFVTKLSSSGSSLAYSTYLGGSGWEVVYRTGIAVDGSGSAYVTSDTDSTDFPTKNAYQGTYAGGYDSFVTKLSSSGSSLAYSTYLGGSGDDITFDLAVDGYGNAYVTGQTDSANLPTNNPYQGAIAGDNDAFVTKLSSSGSSLAYSTYLGGSAGDAGSGIAVDGTGNAFVTGTTTSTNFPTRNAYQGTRRGVSEGFVTKLSPSWWEGAVDLGGGWRWFSWLGYFNVNTDPWIYHQQLGWMSATGTTSSLYLYSQKMGGKWLWTSSTQFPYMYRFDPTSWLWYQRWTTNPCWFNDLTHGDWESY